ncbi:hypothetical protein M758_11G139800 [Ceratodon purpureus]|nr:hypothetical protein M758_11G139800 [Ceratodon purpureus]
MPNVPRHVGVILLRIISLYLWQGSEKLVNRRRHDWQPLRNVWSRGGSWCWRTRVWSRKGSRSERTRVADIVWWVVLVGHDDLGGRRGDHFPGRSLTKWAEKMQFWELLS